MNAAWRKVRRWVGGTSNRTFVLWPLVLLLLQALLDRGWPHLSPRGLPLLAWGYGQYKLAGIYRTRLGGGGPGLSNPPERLVTSGIYRVTRNPMYLGHLVFFLGLAVCFSGLAWTVFAAHLFWFDRRARADEPHMLALFGDGYAHYCAGVKRWVPGIY